MVGPGTAITSSEHSARTAHRMSSVSSLIDAHLAAPRVQDISRGSRHLPRRPSRRKHSSRLVRAAMAVEERIRGIVNNLGDRDR